MTYTDIQQQKKNICWGCEQKFQGSHTVMVQGKSAKVFALVMVAALANTNCCYGPLVDLSKMQRREMANGEEGQSMLAYLSSTDNKSRMSMETLAFPAVKPTVWLVILRRIFGCLKVIIGNTPCTQKYLTTYVYIQYNHIYMCFLDCDKVVFYSLLYR